MTAMDFGMVLAEVVIVMHGGAIYQMMLPEN